MLEFELFGTFLIDVVLPAHGRRLAFNFLLPFGLTTKEIEPSVDVDVIVRVANLKHWSRLCWR
jgi:hypothetical protein